MPLSGIHSFNPIPVPTPPSPRRRAVSLQTGQTPKVGPKINTNNPKIHRIKPPVDRDMGARTYTAERG
jgi:hypothetical protein